MLDRRQFIQAAAAMGAAFAWGGPARASRVKWTERRNLYPHGVASGDPDPHSVILWTRRPYEAGKRQMLTVEVAEDAAFRRVVAHAPAPVSAASDWTARVLVGGLKPSHTYWYRFTDAQGNGSRVGRTITAPAADDPRTINFAFVSCQDINESKLNAYRRMIFEDERAQPADQIEFVLHLGDFIYEVVQYPEEGKPRFDRKLYEVARIPDSLKVRNYHLPTTLEGYRAVWKGFLADPDLQDARARWPFICTWDNHEFSWQGWQSILKAPSIEQPGQTIKVAANQAWFENIPARVKAPSGTFDEFGSVAVKNVKIDKFGDDGLGLEPNNIAAINSLIIYRALRFGRHLDLLLTDERSYRGPNPFEESATDKLADWADYGMFPDDLLQALDGGRAFNGGNPPAELEFNGAKVPNPNKDKPPQTILGGTQKAWFKNRLRTSGATWKIWASSQCTLEQRADPENFPEGLTKQKWPAGRFANVQGGDFGSAWVERSEIYDLVRDAKITGLAIVSGDLHSFWAGYASAQLPPGKFEPIGLSFTGGSISSVGGAEAHEYVIKKDDKFRPLYLADRPGAAKPEHTYNMMLRHGVRSCFEYAKSFDRAKALALANPDVAPHLEFVDIGGHGYAKVRLSSEEMRTEFVCIPRPVTRSERPDGGPLRYRVAHTAKLWKPGEAPKLVAEVLEGDPGLSI
ncbi:alkaline phosphatase D family protein [Sphingomonas sp. RB56-2]|uniref:Alkaline phosphatase D family protein n=1 Tax=Sphingomonas brevis TaxID=2908206 RepID=A0ABT0S6E4_9SPHN|nr:alkaline phosphatase D family protein [Sphingomonas brevis]MCL6739872.1 alkaline phosphatase D family protein [Sphingomonas brevis]